MPAGLKLLKSKGNFFKNNQKSNVFGTMYTYDKLAKEIEFNTTKYFLNTKGLGS